MLVQCAVADTSHTVHPDLRCCWCCLVELQLFKRLAIGMVSVLNGLQVQRIMGAGSVHTRLHDHDLHAKTACKRTCRAYKDHAS